MGPVKIIKFLPFHYFVILRQTLIIMFVHSSRIQKQFEYLASLGEGGDGVENAGEGGACQNTGASFEKNPACTTMLQSTLKV